MLREIIRVLRKKHVKSPDAIAITASTGNGAYTHHFILSNITCSGIAACNIGGVTIHSFAGIGIGEGSVEDLLNKVRKNKKAASRWLRTKVLIIDEGAFRKYSHRLCPDYNVSFNAGRRTVRQTGTGRQFNTEVPRPFWRDTGSPRILLH